MNEWRETGQLVRNRTGLERGVRMEEKIERQKKTGKEGGKIQVTSSTRISTRRTIPVYENHLRNSFLPGHLPDKFRECFSNLRSSSTEDRIRTIRKIDNQY